MKTQSEKRIKHACCSPESALEPTGLSRALKISNQQSSTSITPYSPFLSLSKEETKALEAYKLQVERARSIALLHAQRNTIR